MNTYELIKQAIVGKKSVTCYYKGLLRLMSPHVIGIKNGKPHALFYQYAGQSNSGLSSDRSKNWRCIPVNDILNLELNNDAFQTANNHSTGQVCVDRIDVEVDY